MALSAKIVRLVVNADDFGLTAGVNRAVGELAAHGALRSATLMANGDAFIDAVAIADRTNCLGVGCHVVLVDGSAVAPLDEVSALVDASGQLEASLVKFVARLQSGRIPELQIEREATAQIRRLQSAGVTVTHVDTHKHTHLFPGVARPLLRAAMACGVGGIRNPFEQAWSAGLTRGALLRRLEVSVLRNFQSRFHRLLRASGLRSTDGSIGVSATGSLDAATLQLLLDRAEGGTWELVCHPGYNDADLDNVKTRLRGTREVERAALLNLLPSAVRSGQVELINFNDL
ncbi:MAG: ChbG/HpnK family deacetylase [Janthinobacterium lividum]